MANDRYLQLAECLKHAEVTVDRKRRSTLAGQIAGLDFLVRIERQSFLAVPGPDVDSDTFVGPGRLDTHFAQRTSHVQVSNLFRRLAVDHAEDVQIVDG